MGNEKKILIFRKNQNLDRIRIFCPYCTREEVHVIDSFVNYNPGDSLVSQHLHVNLLCKCNECAGIFAIRGLSYSKNLYYADLSESGITDMSEETAKRLNAGDVVPGKYYKLEEKGGRVLMKYSLEEFFNHFIDVEKGGKNAKNGKKL